MPGVGMVDRSRHEANCDLTRLALSCEDTSTPQPARLVFHALGSAHVDSPTAKQPGSSTAETSNHGAIFVWLDSSPRPRRVPELFGSRNTRGHRVSSSLGPGTWLGMAGERHSALWLRESPVFPLSPGGFKRETLNWSWRCGGVSNSEDQLIDVMWPALKMDAMVPVPTGKAMPLCPEKEQLFESEIFGAIHTYGNASPRLPDREPSWLHVSSVSLAFGFWQEPLSPNDEG